MVCPLLDSLRSGPGSQIPSALKLTEMEDPRTLQIERVLEGSLGSAKEGRQLGHTLLDVQKSLGSWSEGPQLVLTTVITFCKGLQITSFIKDLRNSGPPEC